MFSKYRYDIEQIRHENPFPSFLLVIWQDHHASLHLQAPKLFRWVYLGTFKR